MSSAGVVRVSEARLEGVGKRFGAHWAVRDVSIALRPGELYTLLGPARSGKSTLLRLLAGLETPDEGRIVVDDECIDAVPPDRRNLGMVFPGYALWPHLSVLDNLTFGLRQRGVGGEQLQFRAGAALADAGLADRAADRPDRLAPAEALRLALARAVIVQPRLLLLDEPLAGLPAEPRLTMRQELARRLRAAGITTLLATADPAEALDLATRIAVLRAGQVVQEGRPEEVYWQPRSRFAAELVGPVNLVPVRVIELRDLGVVVETQGGARMPVAASGRQWQVGEAGVLCLRPEALSVEEAERAAGGIRGTIAGHVFEGGRQRYDVAITGTTVRVEMLTSAALGRSFRPGDHVKIEVSPETSTLLPPDPPTTVVTTVA